VNILLDNPMTQFSFEWILSLNWLCQKWGQVHGHPKPFNEELSTKVQNMDRRYLLVPALAAAVASPLLLLAQKPVPPPKNLNMEKCYGIAKAGKSDCAPLGTIPVAAHRSWTGIQRPGSTSRKDTANE
jgi:uncharacterized membrane protein